MEKKIISLMLFVLLTVHCFSQTDNAFTDYPISPIPFSEVKITDNFWGEKIKINHEVTIPIAIEQSEITGRIDNFRKAAGLMEGPFGTEYPFDDTDIYKILEAASYSLQTNPDPVLESRVDELIALVAAAQEKDGYLFTSRTISEGDGHPWNGDERWEKVNELSHELYNLGHLFEAASAHFLATGKESLLQVAVKAADLIVETFGPGKLENYPGHQEVEIGLVKLYRITGKREYLDLAKFFLDIRGKEGIGRPDSYNQSHLPVTEQTTAVGHSVRASYMWTAMADVAALTGNSDYINAINTLWSDVTNKQYYINGGIGSTSSHEGFGGPYVLPNMTAYNETCAGVGNSTWNHRMFLMTGDGKYMDILERTMYNNILSGVSVSGDRFFYPNPLASQGQHQRSEWFGCACCPPNVARFLPSMPGYIYAKKDRDVFVNLFISSEVRIPLEKDELHIVQETTLPWWGNVKITIQKSVVEKTGIKIRIPSWARNKPVPGDLYFYMGQNKEQISVKLNGETQEMHIDDQGYLYFNRLWKEKDRIEIVLPMNVHTVLAHEKVKEDQDKIALERGPLLYVAEWPDNSEGVLNIMVDPEKEFRPEFDPKLLGGIMVLHGEAKHASRKLDGTIELSNPKPLKLIPYHLWNNRGSGEMNVWLPISKEVTIPSPAPTLAARSSITSSKGSRSLSSITDQLLPDSSGSHQFPFFHWWPKKDSWEWVEFNWEQPEKISNVSVYWFDDRPWGGTRIPVEWEVLYLNAKTSEWESVRVKNDYSVSLNDWDKVNFKPVKTNKIRVRVHLSPNYASGIHEIIIK